MTRLSIASAALLSLAALCACKRAAPPANPPTQPVKPAAYTLQRLDCPEKQGKLIRVSAAADGASCVYSAAHGEVTLRLVPLAGADAQVALTPIETELRGLMPMKKPLGGGQSAADRKAEVELPGVSINAGGGAATQIRVGKLQVNAEGKKSAVKIDKTPTPAPSKNRSVSVATRGGAVDLQSEPDGAEIRRMNRADNAIRATYLIASDKSASGFRLVGYEAHGPKDGPLAVAVVKARDRDAENQALFADVKALVKRNVGV